jgi:hypothetical protein
MIERKKKRKENKVSCRGVGEVPVQSVESSTWRIFNPAGRQLVTLLCQASQIMRLVGSRRIT